MTIEAIIQLYENDLLPARLNVLRPMQSMVEDYAKSSLELAHHAEDTETKHTHFNKHVSYITISSYLDFKISKVLSMEGGTAQ
jgi:hypothetical protein